MHVNYNYSTFSLYMPLLSLPSHTLLCFSSSTQILSVLEVPAYVHLLLGHIPQLWLMSTSLESYLVPKMLSFYQLALTQSG
jgi:hypothetical protein